MREPPPIIKAINALKRASFDEPIAHIPYIREEMAEELEARGYATKTPWSKDPAVSCYRLTPAAWAALEERPEPARRLPSLKPRLSSLPPRLKPLDEK